MSAEETAAAIAASIAAERTGCLRGHCLHERVGGGTFVEHGPFVPPEPPRWVPAYLCCRCGRLGHAKGDWREGTFGPPPWSAEP